MSILHIVSLLCVLILHDVTNYISYIMLICMHRALTILMAGSIAGGEFTH